jgi:hypothetical protein
MKKNFLLPLFVMAFLVSFGQRPTGQRPSPVTISGFVFDKETGQPLEYATITCRVPIVQNL